MNSFDLIYIELATNKIFHARRLLLGEYKIREPMRPESEKKITKYKLVKEYKYQGRISNESVKLRSRPIILANT